MPELYSVEERDRASERTIQEALTQQGISLGAVSNAGLCGEILRRIKNRMAMTEAAEPMTATAIANAVSALPGLAPAAGEDESGWSARLQAVLDKLLATVGPILLDWITKNLPVILQKLLGGIMGS